jgi:NADPH-dependent curcumin reductase CurA
MFPLPRTNQRWLLTARPQGLAKESDFFWDETPADEPAEGQVVVRVIYLSLDPTNRNWMNRADSYMPAVPIGAVMRGMGVGVVEESRGCDLHPGDIVQGLLGWQLYATMDAAYLNKLPLFEIPLAGYFGVLGHIGLTAYVGLLDIAKPQAGETLVVSAAAGAVGSLVGQIGKIKGCRVVGIAGSEAKCRWLKDELGFDAVVNHRIENLDEALRRHCPEGVNIYFDNVGGRVLEAVLGQLALRARIVCCGMISQYNSPGTPGPANLGALITRRARMEGFLCSDYGRRAPEAFPELMSWAAAGKLKYRVDIVEGLENAPTALNRLFNGTNSGKLVVKVSPEPIEAPTPARTM